MRRTLLALVMVFLPVMILAQEPSAPSERTQTSPQRSSEQTQTPAERPQREDRARTTPTQPSTPPSQPEPAQAGGAPGEGIRSMHFDMAEVPPQVTHHEVRVDGKALRYTATAGRLPIKDA